MNEFGTLKDLDVKPGDAVECNFIDDTLTCVRICGENGEKTIFPGEYELKGEKYGEGIFSHNDPSFRIISRANTPKLWRDMTQEEKGALLLADHEGKVIECRNETWDNDYWTIITNPSWHESNAYRVRPEPKVETVTINYWEVATDVLKNHRITFNTIDGKPDCASIKMEAL